MKNNFLLLIAAILFIRCGEQQNEKTNVEKAAKEVKGLDNQKDSLTIANDVVETHFSNEKETLEFDTIISAKDLTISIYSKPLDSYVTNEYESEGVKHIDKYRDSEKHLIITNSNEIVVDTVFTKNDFVFLAGKDFLKAAVFHGYWFNGIQNETIELFGVINKPETDWSVAFHHYFDLKTKEFKLIEKPEEEITENDNTFTSNTDFETYIVYPDSLPLFDSPNGNIIRYFRFEDDPSYENEGSFVFKNSTTGWLQIGKDKWNPTLDGVWIKSEFVEIGTRNYNNEIIPLRLEPKESSKESGFIFKESYLKVLNYHNDWVFVKAETEEGWLAPEYICTNPITNCN